MWFNFLALNMIWINGIFLKKGIVPRKNHLIGCGLAFFAKFGVMNIIDLILLILFYFRNIDLGQLFRGVICSVVPQITILFRHSSALWEQVSIMFRGHLCLTVGHIASLVCIVP